MDGHFVGSSNKQGGKTPPLQDQDTSLAVLQFVVLARGEWAVQAPTSPFRVEAVTAEERYCLGCCRVRRFDVVEGFRVPSIRCQVVICRCCGKEYRYERK